jgi:hypothetical protein
VATFIDTDAARYYRALIELARGRVLDAERDLRALRTSPQPRLRADSAYSLALIAYESGDFDAVNSHLMSALAAGLEGDGRADALLLLSYSNLKLGRAELCREYARLYACAAPRA